MSMDWFRSNRKSFKKTPFEVDHFFWSDRSDQKMTVPFDHSDSFLFPVAASVYRCSFCDVTVPGLENLLSYDCQAITGKCSVYLFVAFAEKKIHPSKKSVCVRVSNATIPAKTNHGCQHGRKHAQITQQEIKNSGRT